MRPYKCTVVFGIIYFLVFPYSGSQSDVIQARGRGNPAPTGFAI
jgi:hypothetical protein